MKHWFADEAIRYRLAIASRVFAAAIVGYVLTSAFTVLLALIWPLPKAEAVAASTLLSFSVYLLVILWVFSVGNLARMWMVLLGSTAVICALAWLLLPGAAA